MAANWALYKDRLAAIREEWDKAEADIKQAEQVCGQVVFPSIKELRYAGRRLVEILTQIENNASEAVLADLFSDAEFDCIRARHDAIDAATAKVALDLENAAEKLGYLVLCQAFPKFSELRLKLAAVRGAIVKSRGNRTDRKAIYAVLESIDFPQLVGLFSEFQASEPVMKDMATAERRKSLRNSIFGWVGVASLIASVIGILITTN